MNNEDMQVQSISDFINWIKSTLSVETEQDRYIPFYRGHADEHYLLQPGVYRTDNHGNSYRNNESRMYSEMLRRDPVAFTEDNTVFERLARMQHYGLPTRLLDLTQNPLIALFFACKGQEKKDGQVIFFNIHQHQVLYQQNLSEVVLAGVEHPLDFQELGYKICNSLKSWLLDETKFSTEHSELNNHYLDVLNRTISGIENITSDSDFLIVCQYLEHHTNELNKFYQDWKTRLNNSNQQQENDKLTEIGCQLFLENFHNRFNQWEMNLISQLCKQMNIKQHMNYAHLFIFLRTITLFNFVLPMINNKRLENQKGAFLVYPPVNSSILALEKVFPPKRVRIKAQVKKMLLDDLAKLGITQSYIFPELTEQAKDICTIYSLR